MKKIKYYIQLSIVTLTAGFLGSCSDYFDINENPNQITDPAPYLTLTAAEVDLANFFQGPYNTAAAFWMNYYTQAGNVAGQDNRDQYNILPGDNAYQNDFMGLYSGPLEDLALTAKNATAAGDDNTAAVAELLTVYTYQMLVDMFDRVPYFQANKISEFPAPVYDGGQEIYDDLIARIDNAMAKISGSATIEGDIIFDGAMRQWIKFGNTLKLKIFMRQSDARPSVAEDGVKSLEGAEFLNLEAEVKFDQSNPANRHPDGVTDINVQSFTAASATSIDALIDAGDPRLDNLWRKPVNVTATNPTGAHRGVPQGLSSTLTGSESGLSYYSARGNFLIGTGSAHPFFSLAEVNFLLAEAAVRGWLGLDAVALYNAGIEASFLRTGTTGAAGYIGNHPLPAGDTDAQLEAIMYEKWIAMTGRQAIEMWAEWRRTGYPGTDLIDVSPISILPAGEFPVRFPVTQREIDLNANAPEPTPLYTPVWWDVD